MRSFSFFTVVVITFTAASQAREDEIKCESYEKCFEASNCCIMTESTEIKSTDVIILKRDSGVGGIDFSENKNIFYLPVLVHEKFPNLVVYHAYHCSIRGVSKKNFEKLSRLEDLNLNSNQIEKIRYDTFEDLLALRQLHISSNKIKQINGIAIEKLTVLDRVDLRKNKCIDKWFSAEGNLHKFNEIAAKKISDYCYFDEPEPESLQAWKAKTSGSGVLKSESLWKFVVAKLLLIGVFINFLFKC